MLKITEQVLQACEAYLSREVDKDFLRRVWARPLGDYANRLRAIGFSELGSVLDAGCGFGQWSVALASIGNCVEAIDRDAGRIESLCHIIKHTCPGLVNARKSDIETTPFGNRHFDGIFCYSAIYNSDYRRTLTEFHRLVRPGGLLYVNTNDIGWYIYNLLHDHNPSTDFSPREMAIQALENSLRYFSGRERSPEHCIIMPMDVFMDDLEASGFEVIGAGPDGTVGTSENQNSCSFYPGEYYDRVAVYEVLCQRREDND